MKWLLGTAAVFFAFVFGAWYFSIEHADPVTLALERELHAAANACRAEPQLAIPVEARSDSAELRSPEEASSCQRSVSMVLVDVTPLLKSDHETAVGQLADWRWEPQVPSPPDNLPGKPGENANRAFFDRSLGPMREWWDPRPAMGCSRHYQIALDTAADGRVIKAYAYEANAGFTICS